MEINKEMLNNFRTDFDRIAKVLGDKYGLAIKMNSSLKYTSNSIMAGFKAVIVGTDEDGNSDSFEKVEFERLCARYGFTPEDYECRVLVAGSVYYLVGFKEKARKNKFIIKDDNGKTYVCAKVEKL